MDELSDWSTAMHLAAFEETVTLVDFLMENSAICQLKLSYMKNGDCDIVFDSSSSNSIVGRGCGFLRFSSNTFALGAVRSWRIVEAGPGASDNSSVLIFYAPLLRNF